MKYRRRFVAVVFIGILTLVAAGFAQSLTFGVSVDKLFPGRQAELAGLKAAAQAANVKLHIQVADGDAQQQNAQIQTLINQKVDALLVVAVDKNAITKAITAAKKAGIPVVAFDRALPGNDAVRFFAGYGSLADGTTCGKFIASKADGKPHTVLELLGALNDQNAIDRSKGFETGLKEGQNLTIIKAPTDWNASKALASTQNAFQAHPDIWAVFIPSDFMMSSIETALKSANRFAATGQPGHVYTCAIDGSYAGYTATKAGWNDGLVVLSLYQVGETAFNAAKTLATGGTLSSSEKLLPSELYTPADIAANASKIWGYEMHSSN